MKTPRRPKRHPQPNPDRRLKPSGKGRLKFLPGDAHVLDDQLDEARNYRRLLDEQTSQLEQLLAAFNLSELREQINQEDEALKRYLWERYHDHKHRDHLLATFLIARRRRRLERMQAAEKALMLAREFLAPDDTLLQQLQQAIEKAQEHKPKDQEEESSIDRREIYGGAEATRARLAAFNEEVEQMRAAITSGTGWLETYWIEKQRLTREARAYLKKGKDLPESVAMFEAVVYGPYLKYRWREKGDEHAPIYTIQMGLIPFEEAPAEGEEGEEQPPLWPNL